MGLKYKYTPNSVKRDRIKFKKKRFDVRAYYDLFPELWEEKRKKIMREE